MHRSLALFNILFLIFYDTNKIVMKLSVVENIIKSEVNKYFVTNVIAKIPRIVYLRFTIQPYSPHEYECHSQLLLQHDANMHLRSCRHLLYKM